MPDLKLEAGRTYRTENGSRVTLYAHDNPFWPFIGQPGTYWPATEYWAANGLCYGDKYGNAGPGMNIVAEWTEKPSLADRLTATGSNSTSAFNPPPTAAERQAQALEKIADALSDIAALLAARPIATGATVAPTTYKDSLAYKLDPKSFE